MMDHLPEIYKRSFSLNLKPKKQDALFSLKLFANPALRYPKQQTFKNSFLQNPQKSNSPLHRLHYSYKRKSGRYQRSVVVNPEGNLSYRKAQTDSAGTLVQKMNYTTRLIEKMLGEDAKKLNQIKVGLQRKKQSHDQQLCDTLSDIGSKIQGLKQLMSAARRQTNMETKLNKKQAQILRQQLDSSSIIINQINQKTNFLAKECKLEQVNQE